MQGRKHGSTVEGRQLKVFKDHGLCAADSFLVRINPFEIVRNKFGLIHPNPQGQQAYVDALYQANTSMLRKEQNPARTGTDRAVPHVD